MQIKTVARAATKNPVPDLNLHLDFQERMVTADSLLRYQSKACLADIGQPIRDVRFIPTRRHAHHRHQCPLSAISGNLQEQGARTLVSGSKTDRSTDIA